MRGWKLAAALVLALAAILRFWGLDYGLPAVYHQDEPILMNHALAAAADMGRPGFYILPALPMYVIDIGVGVFFVVGKLSGLFRSADDLLTLFLTDPTIFYLTARVLLGALPGVLTVWVVMRAAVTGLTIGPMGALAAGILAAFSPLAVQHAHYGYSDTLVTLALAVYLFQCLRLIRGGGTRAAWGIGIAMGLAAACKYNAIFYAPAAAVAWLASADVRGRRLEMLGRMTLGCAAAFCIGSPYTILDGGQALAQILKQADATEAPGLWHHVQHSLAHGTHESLLLAAGAGILLLIRDRTRRAEALVIGVYAASGLVSLGWFSQQFARYALPLIPALTMLAGVTVAACLRRDRRLGIAAAVMLSTPMLLTTADLLRLMPREDTRTACLAWFKENVPAGTVVARDHTFFAPPLRQDPEWVLTAAGPADGVRRQKSLRLAEVNAGFTTYKVMTIRPTPDFAAPFQGQRPLIDATREALTASGVEYVIFNGSDQTAGIIRLRDEIACGAPAAIFDPFRGKRKTSSDPIENTAAPLRRDALSERDRLGPYLEVYRLPGSCAE